MHLVSREKPIFVHLFVTRKAYSELVFQFSHPIFSGLNNNKSARSGHHYIFAWTPVIPIFLFINCVFGFCFFPTFCDKNDLKIMC